MKTGAVTIRSVRQRIILMGHSLIHLHISVILVQNDIYPTLGEIISE